MAATRTIPADTFDLAYVVSGTLPGGPVGIYWHDGTLYAMRPLEWPEAARLLRELERAPDVEASGSELLGVALSAFIDDRQLWRDDEPLPVAAVYEDFVAWFAENPPAFAPPIWTPSPRAWSVPGSW